MNIIREVPNFETLTVAKRQARVGADGTVRVWELDFDNNELRHYTTHIANVSYPALHRAFRKQHFNAYITVPVIPVNNPDVVEARAIGVL
jgi:hypothetical protein